MPPLKSRLFAAACLLVVWAATLTACASGEMQPPSMPTVTQELEMRVLGGGCVEYEGERQPVEAAVLKLRQRVRPMPQEAVSGIRVTIAIADSADESAMATSDMIMTHLQLMGILSARIE